MPRHPWTIVNFGVHGMSLSRCSKGGAEVIVKWKEGGRFVEVWGRISSWGYWMVKGVYYYAVVDKTHTLQKECLRSCNSTGRKNNIRKMMRKMPCDLTFLYIFLGNSSWKKCQFIGISSIFCNAHVILTYLLWLLLFQGVWRLLVFWRGSQNTPHVMFFASFYFRPGMQEVHVKKFVHNDEQLFSIPLSEKYIWK